MEDSSPLIIGAGGGGGKGGGAQTRTPYTAPDSLDSTQYATVLDLLSEGEIAGLKNGLASIFLNNTPLAASSKTGTFTRATVSSPLVITINSHGYTNGQQIYVDAYGNSPCYCTVANATANQFTVSEPVALNGYTWSAGNVTTYTFNFQNVTVYTRNGTQSQSYIPIGGTSNTVLVNQPVTAVLPVVQQITNTAVNRIKVTISVPALYEQKTNGDLVGASFQLQIQVQYNNGGYVTVINDTVTGRTNDAYQREYNVPFTGAFPVDVRVVRVTADSGSPSLVNAFSWSTYTTVTDSKLRYPNSALVGLRIDAEQFSSIPERTYLIRGIKVAIPNNGTVDSTTGRITYAGVWNGTFGAAQWTSDPAWILWDLLTSTRYGFGDHIKAAQLDKWAFYSASQYCSTLVPNGLGGTEPRFSCNVNIQTAEEAYTLINNLCSVFRAMPFWSAGALTVSQDKPTDPAYLFTLANVTEEGFTYENSSRKGRPTVAVVKYLDLTTRDVAYEVVEDQAAIAKYGVVTTQLDAFACTSRGQAARIGRWLLYSEAYESEIVTFSASIDAGVMVRPGQVISISDPVRAGSRRGGRISSATTSAIVVDNATGLPASGGTLSVILPDGTVQSRTVGTRSGTTVPVTSNFTTAPNANSVWIWETNDLQPSTWRVLGIQEQDGTNYAISAISYNASKYAYVEANVALTQRDVSNLNELPAAPTSLGFTEQLYRYQDQIRAKIVAAWQPVLGVNEYSVQYRKDSGNWVTARVQGPDYEVLDITPGLFEFRIFSLNAAGKQSTTALTGSVTALGKTAPPSNVANFAATIDANLGVLFSWSPITPAPPTWSDLDLAGYEIRTANSNWGTINAAYITNVTASTYKLGLLNPSTTTYYIKAIDTSGIYSTAAASVTVTISAPSAVQSLTNTIADDIATLTWTAPATGSYAIRHYEIIYNSQVVGRANTTAFTVPITWIGTRAYTVQAIDIAGNQGTAATTNVVVNAAAAPASISITNSGPAYVLTWSAVDGTTKTRAYEIFADSVAIGRSQTTTFTGNIDWYGTKTFTVRALDANENAGTLSTAVSLTFAQAPAPTLASPDFSNNLLTLSWTAPVIPSPTLPISEYRIYRVDAGVDVLVDTTKTTSYKILPTWTGAKTFKVTTVTSNNQEGLPGSVVATITAPALSSATASFSGEFLELKWVLNAATTFDIATYKVYRTSVVDPPLAQVTASTYRAKVESAWTLSPVFWIVPVDVRGNAGTPAQVSVTVQAPNAITTLSQQVIDNNVLLRWNDVTTTLPIVYYELRKGSTWAGAQIIGTKQGLFTSVFETASGTYRYWLAGYDSAGNAGTPVSVEAQVNQPPDYLLRLNQDSTFSGTQTNTIIENGDLLASVNTTETWQDHFSTRSWTTLQDQVNAGYTYYAMPTTATASYVEEVDCLAVIANSRITIQDTITNVVGTTTITPTISYKETAGGAWTDFSGREVYATNFRYVKMRLDLDGATDKDLLYVTNLNLRIDAKIRNDAGTGTAMVPVTGATYSQSGTTITVTSNSHGLSSNTYVDLDFTSGTAADGVYLITGVTTNTFTVTAGTSTTTSGNVNLHSGGTVVPFNVPFIDVEGIGVTPKATSAVIAIYDFLDAPNPVYFKVLLFNTSGTRVDGAFSWQARGS